MSRPSNRRARSDRPAESADGPPLGIKIYCVLTALLAIFLLLSALAVGAAPGILRVGSAVLSILMFAVVYGLWTLRPWGWVLGMIVMSLNVVLSLVNADVISTVIAAIWAVYLYSKRSYYR